MSSWNERLAVPATAAALSTSELARGFVATITDQGLIALDGEESATFLHSQLTNDVTHLGLADVRLAGYCSPKGRLLASFLMWRTESTIFLQLPREIQPAVSTGVMGMDKFSEEVRRACRGCRSWCRSSCRRSCSDS